MKQIESKRLKDKKAPQIITEEQWKQIVEKGWAPLYNVSEVPDRAVRQVPNVDKPIELTKKSK